MVSSSPCNLIRFSSHPFHPLLYTPSVCSQFWNTFAKVFHGDVSHSCMVVVLDKLIRLPGDASQEW